MLENQVQTKEKEGLHDLDILYFQITWVVEKRLTAMDHLSSSTYVSCSKKMATL